MLGIDLNHLADANTHIEVKYRDPMNDEQTIAVARARAYQRRVIDHRMHRTPKTVNMATLAATCSCNTDCDNHLTTKLSDRVIQAYLDANPDEFADKPLKMSDITLGAIPADMRAMVDSINHKYATVFAQNGNSLPKPMIGIPAHKFKLKPDAEPTYDSRPHYGTAQAKLILRWLDWAEEQGLPNPHPGHHGHHALCSRPNKTPTHLKTHHPTASEYAGLGCAQMNASPKRYQPTQHR